MSICDKKKLSIEIFGSGCASLTLADRASELPHHTLTIVSENLNNASDHIWGFWAMPWLKRVLPHVRKKWNKWQIVNSHRTMEMESRRHPYCAIHRKEWLSKLRENAASSGVKFTTFKSPSGSDQILDSRSPNFSKGMMLQHFLGFEVKVRRGTFDDNIAILMDFRCDQSEGMHFIYFLPFSDCHALVESTLFTSNQLPPEFYKNAINRYLTEIFSVEEYSVLREEKGCIPLGKLQPHVPGLVGIGANGGAIRPSSGYAFSFINKQTEQIVKSARQARPLIVRPPHGKFELFMDNIFLTVLKNRPELSPRIFESLANSLSGDEFARFMSGEATPIIWSKVVLAMPKRVFTASALNFRLNNLGGG